MNNSIIQTLLAFAGQEQYLTIPKAFIKFTGSLDSALMLSQLLFWTTAANKHTGRNKGWVYRTDKEWKEQIYLTQYAIRAARKRLEDLGIIETDVRKADGNPTVHYHVLMEPLNDLWRMFTEHPQVENPSFDFADWFLRIRKNDIVDSQEPSSGFARTLTVEINSRDQQYISAVVNTPAIQAREIQPEMQPLVVEPRSLNIPPTMDEPLFADPDFEHSAVQQTLGFGVVESIEIPPPEKAKKESRKTRAKPPTGYAEAVRGIHTALPIKYPHAFAGKAAKLVAEAAQENGWDDNTICDDLIAAYKTMETDPYWQDKEINPTSLAKRYLYWRGKMKDRQVDVAPASVPYKPQPSIIKSNSKQEVSW